MGKNNTDNFRIWVIAGIVGVIIRDIHSLIAKLLGISNLFIWNIAAELFVKGKGTYTVGGHVLGLITDITIGAVLGVITGLFMEWRGKKDYLLKGIGIGLMAWLGFIGLIFHNIPQTRSIASDDPFSAISSFISHLIFGGITAWIINKYVSQNVAQSDSIKEYMVKRHLSFQPISKPVKKPIPVVQYHRNGYKHPSKLIKLSRKFLPKK